MLPYIMSGSKNLSDTRISPVLQVRASAMLLLLSVEN
jgi:hypothetical protein